MTVWIHSPFDNLPQEGFRAQRYWLMAEAFARLGDKVVYWTGDFNHGTKAKRRLTKSIDSAVELRLLNVPRYSKNVSLSRVFSHLVYARRLKRVLCGKPDVIISATPTLGAASVLLDYARKVGARFVVDIQDAWPETFGRLGIPRIMLLPMYRAARRLYREADFVTGVSERYRQIARREDYRVFHHGITPHLSSVSSSTSTSARPPRSLVYIGNLGSGYDLATVVNAIAADESLTLDIAGKGPREGELVELVRKLGLGDRVRFHGYLAADAMRELLAKADVGIVPMRDDSWVGLPYKLGDYLAAGLPVLSSLHGECGELIVREGLGATYEWGSSASFADALKRLPSGRVELPKCLRADLIYPEYASLLRH